MAFSGCTAAGGVLARALPAVRVASMTVSNCTFESAVVVDQALYARVESLALVAVRSTAGANSTLLPGAAACGGGLRVNNVALSHTSGVSASGLRMAADAGGGGAVCVSDTDHATTKTGGSLVAMSRDSYS